MKIKYWILFVVCCLFFGIYSLSGCGTTGTNTPTTSTTTTTIATSNIVLSGTLAAGSISSSGVKANTAVNDYKVVAIDNNTGKTYSAVPNSSGQFSLTLPNNISYEVSLVDANSANYFGPIVMSGNTTSSEVMMGIKPSSDADLGQIVVDSSLKYAKPTSEPTSIINPMDKAVASSGKPKGAGGYGKQTNSGITSKEGADMDKDGIPNLFDADEDNDGIMNGILSLPTCATVSSNTVETVYMSSNIWANHGTSDEAKDQIAMWLNVIPKTGKLDEITSIEVVNVPSTIKDIATVKWSSSIGDPTNYPTENSLWKTSGYQLYKTTTLSRNQWIISLCPKAIMSLGDTFTLRVYYTAGGYEDFYISMAYVLTDWARITQYNSTALAITEGTSTNPRTISGTSLAVVIAKPKDEDGNVLTGLSYSIRYGTCEAQSGQYGVPTPGNTSEESITDSTLSSTTISYTITNLSPNAANWAYYVTPVAESGDGQRNGEQTWFIVQ